jgi:hypothetical protein
MKPTPKTETFKAFTAALQRIVSVPKSVVDERIKAKKKPRTKHGASGRASEQSL